MDIGDDKVFMYMKTRIAKTEHPMLFGIQEVVDDPYISIKDVEDGISQLRNDVNQSLDLSFEQLVELFQISPPQPPLRRKEGKNVRVPRTLLLDAITLLLVGLKRC